MKNVGKILAVLVMVISLSGCASIVSKSMYPVTINSHPDEASIIIADEYGTQMYKGKTPATISLSSGEAYFHAKHYTVTFTKEGYEDQTAVIKSTMDGWFIGNLLFGGIIGVLIVDPITGAMWKLPKQLTVTLAEKVAFNDQERTLRVVAIDQLPKSLRKHLIRIN